MKPKKKNQLAENPNIWGTSYVKIPRKVLDMSLSQRASERNRGKLLILLYSQVYFKDGFVQNRNTCYICKRGYCIVNASKLADMAEIQIHAVRRYLRELQRAGYIEMSRNVYATMIKINQFDEFMKEFSSPIALAKQQEENPPKEEPSADTPPENKPFKQQPPKNLGNDYWGSNQ